MSDADCCACCTPLCWEAFIRLPCPNHSLFQCWSLKTVNRLSKRSGGIKLVSSFALDTGRSLHRRRTFILQIKCAARCCLVLSTQNESFDERSAGDPV